ncbi:MAG: type II toxin-antitoxin system PemK/MazF family toxin [Spirochaetaceae bacterium]|jgi:mRNA interferase MazF|nr:type II toxin-antitoxin system PemK/MazF family toxin [Spirochaetaceae bacterium]
MAEFVKGDVVIIPFPFSDLSGAKRRPAFVVADIPGPDIILCQITSKAKSDPYAVMLENSDFVSGSLPLASYIRPNKLFTADKSIILSVAGQVSDTKTNAVISILIELIHSRV